MFVFEAELLKQCHFSSYGALTTPQNTGAWMFSLSLATSAACSTNLFLLACQSKGPEQDAQATRSIVQGFLQGCLCSRACKCGPCVSLCCSGAPSSTVAPCSCRPSSSACENCDSVLDSAEQGPADSHCPTLPDHALLVSLCGDYFHNHFLLV